MSIARSFFPIIAGLTLGCVAGCRDTRPSAPPLRLTLDHPAELDTDVDQLFGLSLAPDGRRLIYVTKAEGPNGGRRMSLSLRDLRTSETQALNGTTDGALPFWSPDGESMAFFAGGALRRLRLATGAVDDLAAAPSPRGGAWHADGEIVFAANENDGLMIRRVDGTVQPFTTLDTSEWSHRFPTFFGTDHVVFFVRSSHASRQGIWVVRRDRPTERKRLVGSDAAGFTIDDWLVYASGNALVAHRLDLQTLSLTGRTVLLGSPVGRGTQHQLLATAGADLLLYGDPPSLLRVLRWVDAAGATTGTIGEPMIASDVRVSPAGNRVAVSRVDPQLRTLDIWTYDDQRPVPRRISGNIDVDESPAWSRDAGRIAWTSAQRVVSVRDSLAQQPESALRQLDAPARVTDWSPDGRWLIVSVTRSESGADVMLLPTHASAEIQAYAQTPFNETFGTTSPDGRWLAYASDESGQMEIYIDGFPKPGRRGRASVGGGTEPRWSGDGRSVFFRRGPAVHHVALDFATGRPEAISSTRVFDAGADIRSFDVAPDGTRWLLNVPAANTERPVLTGLVNVRSLLPSAP